MRRLSSGDKLWEMKIITCSYGMVKEGGRTENEEIRSDGIHESNSKSRDV